MHHVRIASVRDDEAVARDHAQELMELPLDGSDIGIDIGVIVLEIVQHRGARPVVHELRTLVEERGVVFVGFDNEKLAAAESRRDIEIARHTADEEAWFEARMLQNPRENARGRGLAVRASHGQRPAVRQQVPRQPLRTGGVRDAAFEQSFDQRDCRGS